MFAGASTQPYATPVDKKTISLGASASNMNLRSKNKGSSTMVVPVRRRLRKKTSPEAAQRVPSMGVVRRRMRSKGPPPPAYAQLPVPRGSGGVPGADRSGGGPPPPDPGPPASNDRHALPPDFQFDLVDMIHQMMEVMVMTQEEIQTRMATRPP